MNDLLTLNFTQLPYISLQAQTTGMYHRGWDLDASAGASKERGKEEFTSHSAKALNSSKAKMLDILFNVSCLH